MTRKRVSRESDVINYHTPIIFGKEINNFVMSNSGFWGVNPIVYNQDGTIDLLEPGIYSFDFYLSIIGSDQVLHFHFNVIEVVNNRIDFERTLGQVAAPLILIGHLGFQCNFGITRPTKVVLINASTPSGIGQGEITLSDFTDPGESHDDHSGQIIITSYTRSL